MGLKIYGIAQSRACRTLWMAEELGIPYEHIKTAVIDGGTNTPSFRTLNPNRRIPTIDDDGVVVWESVAINLYLAKRYGGPLSGRNAIEDAHITMWSVWATSELEPNAHEVYINTVLATSATGDAAKCTAAVKELQRPLGALETALSKGSGSLVGNRFTVADLNVVSVMYYLRGMPQVIAERPVTYAWYTDALDRPGFKAMVKLREQI